jgi:hypothetical protein
MRHLWIVIALYVPWPAMACSDRTRPPENVVLPAMQTKAIYIDQSWPGELLPVPLSKGVPIAYRERPERSAPVVGRLRQPLDTPLCPSGDPGVLYRSLVPMVWIFTADVTINLLPIETGHEKPLLVADHQRPYFRKKGSQIEVVKYEGEGSYIARLDGTFYDLWRTVRAGERDRHGPVDRAVEGP